MCGSRQKNVKSLLYIEKTSERGKVGVGVDNSLSNQFICLSDTKYKGKSKMMHPTEGKSSSGTGGHVTWQSRFFDPTVPSHAGPDSEGGLE